MKRSLIFCAIALVAVTAHTASADVNVQLNLRYDDPNDESAGGTWELLAGSDAGGIAGLVVLVENIGGVSAAGTTDFDVFESQTVGTVTEIVVGSDLVTPSTDIGLGAGTTGNVADDLFPGNTLAIWANNALLANGTFGASRPAFLTTSGTLNAGANEFSGAAAVAATLGTMSVRGDSVATDGLLPGDANRDGDVDFLDVSAVSAGFPGTGPNIWGTGDFNSSGDTDFLDVSAVSASFNAPVSTPPAITAVPEPASLALFGLGGVAVLAVRRRK